MNKFRVMVVAAVLAGLFCAHPAAAQNITIVSGDGQLVKPFQTFSPMWVLVTDSNGVPQANVTVTWNITGASSNALLLSGGTTITAFDGTTSNLFEYASFLSVGSVNRNTVMASTTAGAVVFNLTESLLASNLSSYPAVSVGSWGTLLPNLLAGQSLTGQAGSTGSTPLQIYVSAPQSGGIGNVSLQLVNYQDPSVGAVVNCAGAAGGEAHTVMTDPTGVATCSPVFGAVPGTGQFYLLVGAGGAPQSSDPTVGPPFANWAIGPLNLTVTAALPGLIRVTQGNFQSAAPGQALASALQVEVDTASGTPVAGQTVNWTVTPAGAASLSSNSTSTDVSGRAAVAATFASNASGAVSIKATCPACPAGAQSVTFSATAVPIVTLSGLQIVSGNNQTSIENATFGLPLVVQVNASNGQGASNVGVQFSVTGPASLSSSTVTTDSNGRAQVSVTAGATAGTVTVTATVGSFTQSFSLTVMPPGPTLTASSFYNGADFKAGSISPCSIATIIAPGLAPGIQGVVTPGSLFGPLPYLLASDAVSFNGTAAPIFNVANVSGQEQITVQVPCEVTPSSAVTVAVTVGTAPPDTVSVPVLAASPGIFQTAMPDGVSRAVIVRPDGSFVSLANPARRGETVRAYATGLGVTAPTVGTNATAIPGADAIVQGILIMGVTNTIGQAEGVRVSTARVAPDLIGVFEIPFQVPSDAATGNNVSFSIGVIPVGSGTPIYSATAKIPIQ
ncbi:MAG: hypothetical protein WBL65_08355 [Bryobacteraceae bacterium]